MNANAEAAGSAAVERTTLGGATVLSPAGSLTCENSAELRAALEQAAEEPRPAVVIDCRQVKAMDSEALELLVEWHDSLREKQGSLTLSNLNDTCSDILMVTRLVHVLTVCNDIRQAVQSGEAQ